MMGAGERLERQMPSLWVLVLGTGRVLHPAGFSSHGSPGHQGEDWQLMEVDTTTEPPSSSTPQMGLQGTWGAERLGAGRGLVPVVPWQEPPLSARHCRAALYGAMENIAGSSSSKGAGVVPLAFFK